MITKANAEMGMAKAAPSDTRHVTTPRGQSPKCDDSGDIPFLPEDVEAWRLKRDEAARQRADENARRAEQATERREREKRERRVEWRKEQFADLVETRGKRYGRCTLDNYHAETESQRAALAMVRDYAAELIARVDAGQNLILYGSMGAGKDHLLFALMATAIQQYDFAFRENNVSVRAKASFFKSRLPTPEEVEHWNPHDGGHAPEPRYSLTWAQGGDVYRAIRDSMKSSSKSESSIQLALQRPAVLALSDPLPPNEGLTGFQQAFLFRVIDARYSAERATWLTVNVADRDELEDRIGQQTADRLLEGAVTATFDWPSWRNPNRESR